MCFLLDSLSFEPKNESMPGCEGWKKSTECDSTMRAVQIERIRACYGVGWGVPAVCGPDDVAMDLGPTLPTPRVPVSGGDEVTIDPVDTYRTLSMWQMMMMMVLLQKILHIRFTVRSLRLLMVARKLLLKVGIISSVKPFLNFSWQFTNFIKKNI